MCNAIKRRASDNNASPTFLREIPSIGVFAVTDRRSLSDLRRSRMEDLK